MTRQIESMTPEELIGRKSYAACRYLDGSFAWLVEAVSSRDRAERKAREWCDATGGDYRVVRIVHRKEG